MRPMIIVMCCCLIGACGDGNTRACFGSTEFCRDAFGRNRAPEADAGADLEATAGERVQLDGSGSVDPDGRIDSYSWTQESGPAVALQGATQALADFVAPEVDTETILSFRLVVTDDDDASDADRVRVTLVPDDVAIVLAGVELLKTVHRPQPGNSAAAECPRCWPFLGLWLGARVQAAACGADPDVDELLDELRVLELGHAGQVPAQALPDAARRLFELGQLQVALFTEQRDPATAELARQLAGKAQPLNARAWHDAIVAAFPELSPGDTPPDDLARAARRLLQNRLDTAAPEAVAAATLLLAQGDLETTCRSNDHGRT
jgi:hypothetical protein